MKCLVKSVAIVDVQSKYNGQVLDILVDNDKIVKIDSSIDEPVDQVIDGKGLSISPGWVDACSFIGEPGYEHQETLQSGLTAASKGGFTAVALMPNTSPAIQSKSEVAFLKNMAKTSVVDVYPLGAISHNLEGKEMTEMYDMYDAGAVAFTDGKKSIQQTDLMLRALMYVKRIDGTIINFPEDKFLAEGGQMNEGIMSAKLGMKGVPHIAEEVMVNRDIQLTQYADSKLHFSKISSAQSVELIGKAKNQGVKVSSGVPSYQLLLNDKDVRTYDSNYKVKPVLRTDDDIKALKQGLKLGTIDLICSNHTPKEEEAKKKEYNLADHGIINYETCVASAFEALKGELKLDQIVEKFTVGPRKVLGLNAVSIEEGQTAELTIFDANEEWIFDQPSSIAKNSPFIGRTFTGKAKYLVNKARVETL